MAIYEAVQDTVHIGVKLKSRLLKPSILLPMGSYIATSSHLLMLFRTNGKATHGLRWKDLSHKDRQSFDAVEHIIKAGPLLSQMPDAVGTEHYISIMRAAVYNYLDKEISQQQHIHDIWYAVFFLRYWRMWILSQPKFTLGDNFITGNAYMCIEMNAHTLLMLTLILLDIVEQFLPWMIGSQPCERMFRALRSMTGTFSTMINFNMLGLLRRLHKLYIQEELQSQTAKSEHGITFPRQREIWQKKRWY
jgi:hypothetical protein